MSEKTDIKSMDLEELKTFFSDMGEKAFRAKQVYEWLHCLLYTSFGGADAWQFKATGERNTGIRYGYLFDWAEMQCSTGRTWRFSGD